MKFTSLMRQLAALALTAVFLTTAALSGFAVYAMPIQAAYPQESIYLFDADTGETLVEQNPDLPRCVASLTKMMTALLVLESGTDLNASITIPDSLTPELQSIRANRGHTIGLQAGETVRRIDMMYAMLLPSANDAASVLANDTSGSLAAFAAQMNVRASQLGCTATHFTCPHGLYDGGNYSTARDMAKIALACYANSTYRRIADTASYRLPATELHPARTITTTNKLLQPASGYYRSYAHGMKTGFTTQAGRCFVTFAQQDGHTYGLVILGSNSQNIFREAAELFDWAFTSPELHPAPVEAEPEKQERGGFWHKLFGCRLNVKEDKAYESIEFPAPGRGAAAHAGAGGLHRPARLRRLPDAHPDGQRYRVGVPLQSGHRQAHPSPELRPAAVHRQPDQDDDGPALP